MFSPDYKSVALIRKLKPDWQKGKLNGIGGKIEMMEPSDFAMIREFNEETGLLTSASQWNEFGLMEGFDFSVALFVTAGDLSELKSIEEEKIEIVDVKDINPSRKDTVENLCWLISMAIDYNIDSRPKFAKIYY